MRKTNTFIKELYNVISDNFKKDKVQNCQRFELNI